MTLDLSDPLHVLIANELTTYMPGPRKWRLIDIKTLHGTTYVELKNYTTSVHIQVDTHNLRPFREKLMLLA